MAFLCSPINGLLRCKNLNEHLYAVSVSIISVIPPNKTIYLYTYYSILSYYLQYLNYTLFIKCHPSANFYTAINFDWSQIQQARHPCTTNFKFECWIHSLTGVLPLCPKDLMQNYWPQVSKNTEPDGSDIEKSKGGIINPSKLGISALQIIRFECSDT